MPKKQFIEEVRNELLAKRTALLDNLNHELNSLRDEAHHLADMEDLASDSRDESTSFSIMAIEQAELNQVERALELIDEGAYGVCEECEEDIGLERLQALPFATMCIECKREQERREGF